MDYLKSNLLTIIVLVVSVASTFAVQQYRINELETKVNHQQERIDLYEAHDIANGAKLDLLLAHFGIVFTESGKKK